MAFFAHTKQDLPPDGWQPLHEHLTTVAQLAAGFAQTFDAGPWGYLAGLWHDLGKFSPEFQQYLRQAHISDSHCAEIGKKIDHSTAGAQHAAASVATLGPLIAHVIAGHHSGLLDTVSTNACLKERLKKSLPPWQPNAQSFQLLQRAENLTLPPFLQEALRTDNATDAGFTFAFFTRMLYSCLVDADFLDTESFMDPTQAAGRPSWPADTLNKMEQALRHFVAQLSKDSSPVATHRRAVLSACTAAATMRRGLFSLTVPTGGGKTLSSLAFALRHALQHNLDRVIYVIPFSSIIEQNADVFRNVMQPLTVAELSDLVVEHHSNLDPDHETLATRLATENWDAPLVVTTSVQFFESLFARRASQCRKLHNIARSVIILDEAQTVPVDFLKPSLCALDQLARNYGCSVVFCTATQPAVGKRPGFDIGLDSIQEIISDPPKLYESLKRVNVQDIGALSDADLVKRLHEHRQVLCIVNTRKHARVLYDLLGASPTNFHLSALMCPAHRSVVLDAIHQRIDADEPCIVVSTQLVEAGVDIDFPVVYRSLAGIDSIAQAAGRCNRNGRAEIGHTFVFRSEHSRSEAYFRDTTNVATQVLSKFTDPLQLKAIENYFKLYYWDQSERWDSKELLDKFVLDRENASLPFDFAFATAAHDFRLIDDDGKSVIIPFDDTARNACERLRNPSLFPNRRLLRTLQRYAVQVPQRIYQRHIHRDIHLVRDHCPVLVCPELHYCQNRGLVLDQQLPTLLHV